MLLFLPAFWCQSGLLFFICESPVRSTPLLSRNLEEVVLIELCLHSLSDCKDNAISGSRALRLQGQPDSQHTARRVHTITQRRGLCPKLGKIPELVRHLCFWCLLLLVFKYDYINKEVRHVVVCCRHVKWIWQWGLLKCNHEIAFGFFIVTLTQPLEYQKPRTETLLVDKQLGGKAQILSRHSCLTFGLVKWVWAVSAWLRLGGETQWTNVLVIACHWSPNGKDSLLYRLCLDSSRGENIVVVIQGVDIEDGRRITSSFGYF